MLAIEQVESSPLIEDHVVQRNVGYGTCVMEKTLWLSVKLQGKLRVEMFSSFVYLEDALNGVMEKQLFASRIQAVG